MADKNDDQLVATPEQIAAYTKLAGYTLAMGKFDKMASTLPPSDYAQHRTQHGCVVLHNLATELLILEVDNQVCIGVPSKHAEWLDKWPLECLVVTANEVFFVSHKFEWGGEKMKPIGVGTGELPPSELISRMCNQQAVYIYEIDNPENIQMARKLQSGEPALVFWAKESVPVLKTREHYFVTAPKDTSHELARVQQLYS